jgi:hypothetical protein
MDMVFSCGWTQNFQFIREQVSVPNLPRLAGMRLAGARLAFCAIFSGMDEKRELLRHTLATLAYRASRTLDGAPESFASFAGAGRLPVQILAHIGDPLDWALSATVGHERWHSSQPLAWADEKQRFFASLRAFDGFLASDKPLRAPVERLFQGPVADALTHVGQLAMLRRLAGSPTRGENFYVAAISVGQVGAEQPAAVKPFK